MNKENKIQVCRPHYDFSYDSLRRFNSYWHQINEVMKVDPHKILEIGVGNKTLANLLEKYGIKVITLDVDRRLNPLVVGDVKNLPFKSDSFELITCFEVLEHLPFEYFKEILLELNRTSKSYVILSIPDAGKYFKVSFKLPQFWQYKKLINAPFQRREEHEFNGEHYWEINKKGYSLKKIKNRIKKTGFKIEKTFRPFENPYHRFFVLRK